MTVCHRTSSTARRTSCSCNETTTKFDRLHSFMMYSSGNNSNGGGGGQLIEWTIIALHNKDNHNTITAGIK